MTWPHICLSVQADVLAESIPSDFIYLFIVPCAIIFVIMDSVRGFLCVMGLFPFMFGYNPSSSYDIRPNILKLAR